MADESYPRIEPIQGGWIDFCRENLPAITPEEDRLREEVLLLLDAGIAAVNLAHAERKYGLRMQLMKAAGEALDVQAKAAAIAAVRIEKKV